MMLLIFFPRHVGLPSSRHLYGEQVSDYGPVEASSVAVAVTASKANVVNFMINSNII